jgi:hypothetical protein
MKFKLLFYIYLSLLSISGSFATPAVSVVNASVFGLNSTNTDVVNGNAVAAMATYANANPNTRIVINNGIYKIKRNAANIIFFNAATNIEIDGNGATFIFSETNNSFNGSFFEMQYCQNMTIRNLTIDWDWDIAPLSAVGKIVQKTSAGVVYEITNNIAINSTPTVTGGREWDNTLKIRSGAGFALAYVDSTRWLDSKHVYVGISSAYRLSQAAVGLYTMLSLINNFSANAFNLVYSNATTIDNVTIYSAPENSFYFSGCKDYEVKNCKVIPKPGTERYRSVHSGGEFHNSEGSILIENNIISYTHDDGMHISDGFIPPYMTNDPVNNKIVIADYLQQYATKYTLTIGDTLEFRNADFSPTGVFAVLLNTKWEYLYPTSTLGGNRCTLTFDRTIPAIPTGAYLFNRRYGRQTFRIANNSFTNNFGNGIVSCIPNGIIENNCISRTAYSGLRIYLTLRWGKWVMGTGPSNVIVRNNSLYECNNGIFQLQPACLYVGAGLDPNGSNYTSSAYRAALTNVTITGNTVFGSDSPGFGLTSVTGATVADNTFVNVGRAPVTTALTANGNIFVENATNVILTNNKIFQPSGTSRKGLVVASSTSNVTSTGLIQQVQQTTPVALPADNIQSTSFTARWNNVSGTASYLLNLYKKNYNQTADSLINQFSVADSLFIVQNLLPNQSYSYNVSIQPSFCNSDIMMLSNRISLKTTFDVSTVHPTNSANIGIYPTICDNVLFLKDCDNASYSVFNIFGKKLLNGINTNAQISVASLMPGAYIIQVEFNYDVLSQKFFKK